MDHMTRHIEHAREHECRAQLRDGEALVVQAGSGLRVRALRSTLHVEVADAFEAAHHAALRRHGVEGLVPRGSAVRARSGTWLIVAERAGQGGAPVAGICLDLRTRAQPLAIELAMPRFGAEPSALLHGRLVGAVGEFTGLWVHEAFRGLGLPAALISAGVTAARLAGLDRLLTLVPAHTRERFAAEGFRVVREMGDDGAFEYPNEHYRSWVMALDLAPRSLCRVGTCGSARGAR